LAPQALVLDSSFTGRLCWLSSWERSSSYPKYPGHKAPYALLKSGFTTGDGEKHVNELQIFELQDREIENVNGGFFWAALPIMLAGGYLLGKDRAIRDNARDAKLTC
jgi:hypothetical protein